MQCRGGPLLIGRRFSILRSAARLVGQPGNLLGSLNLLGKSATADGGPASGGGGFCCCSCTPWDALTRVRSLRCRRRDAEPTRGAGTRILRAHAERGHEQFAGYLLALQAHFEQLFSKGRA